jgi:hypothetical protein
VAKENNMQMIDVLKRLAELDADNPNIIKESQQVEECGMMPGMVPEMGMDIAPEKPSMPASINMTAGSGDELSNMLATIMQLAGQKSADAVSAGPALDNTPPAAGMLEPTSGDSPADTMRSVIDKLNPMDDEGGDDVSKSHGDLDNDGDHDMDDHDMEKDDKKKDEWANEPDEEYKDVDYMVNKLAGGMNRPKGTYPKVAGGDNPMQRTESTDLRASIKAELARRLAEAKGAK